jgi:hypothetical protein
MVRMTDYWAGAVGVTERPWPRGVNDTEIETRLVPRGVVHALDPQSGMALCGSGEQLVSLDAAWEELWRLSWVGGPERCSRCLRLVWGTPLGGGSLAPT